MGIGRPWGHELTSRVGSIVNRLRRMVRYAVR